jgi:hypothetical protein
VKRPALPYVLALSEPRRLCGSRGPLIVGCMSDAPEGVREELLIEPSRRVSAPFRAAGGTEARVESATRAIPAWDASDQRWTPAQAIAAL